MWSSHTGHLDCESDHGHHGLDDHSHGRGLGDYPCAGNSHLCRHVEEMGSVHHDGENDVRVGRVRAHGQNRIAMRQKEEFEPTKSSVSMGNYGQKLQ